MYSLQHVATAVDGRGNIMINARDSHHEIILCVTSACEAAPTAAPVHPGAGPPDWNTPEVLLSRHAHSSFASINIYNNSFQLSVTRTVSYLKANIAPCGAIPAERVHEIVTSLLMPSLQQV